MKMRVTDIRFLAATAAFLLLANVDAVAQLSTPKTSTTLSFRLNPPKARHYAAFNYPMPRYIDYSNYPLTVDQIEAKTSSVKGYNRMYNLVTNRNKNGFVGNLLGLQRVERPHASPKF